MKINILIIYFYYLLTKIRILKVDMLKINTYVSISLITGLLFNESFLTQL
jgi:hypothetical protein